MQRCGAEMALRGWKMDIYAIKWKVCSKTYTHSNVEGGTAPSEPGALGKGAGQIRVMLALLADLSRVCDKR